MRHAETSGFTLDEILHGGISKPLCAVRGACLAECYELLSSSGKRAFSLNRLGCIFGDRDHSTVHEAIRRHKARAG